MTQISRVIYLWLTAVIFLSSAATMVLELTLSRALAPYIGTSMLAWTALIGTILASLGIGNFASGRLNSQSPTLGSLAKLLLLSGISVLVSTILLKTDFFNWLSTNYWNNFIWLSIIMTIIAAGPGSFFLGVIFPYTIRLVLSRQKDARTIGTLSAISTIGSLAGVFGAGYLLIPIFGNLLILLSLAFLLVFLGAVTWIIAKKSPRMPISVIAVVLLAALSLQFPKDPAILFETDTAYQHISIVKRTLADSSLVYKLITGPREVQTTVYADGRTDLADTYKRFFRLSALFHPNSVKALAIGGGGYAYPRDFLASNPKAAIDVVEIDPGMTQVAHDYLFLPTTPRLKSVHMDGRIYIDHTRQKYDTIFVDAFRGGLSPPFSLTTSEAIVSIYNHLTSDGIVMVNMIGSVTGKNSKLISLQLATFMHTFANVKIFAVQFPAQLDALQNIILVASKRPLVADESKLTVEQSQMLACEISLPRGNITQLLTDDFAPVEYNSVY